MASGFPDLSQFIKPFQGINIGSGGGLGSSIMDFLQSPGGSSLVGGALQGLGAYGQQRSNEKMNAQQLALQQALMGQQGQQAVLNDRLARDMGLAQQSPTGWAQDYQQNTLLKDIMLQKLMAGSQFTPTNANVRQRLESLGPAFKPTIPEEWQQVNPFGVQQTMGSLAQRQGVLDLLSGGRAPGLDFSQMGLAPDVASRLGQQTSDYRKFAADDYRQATSPLTEAIGMSNNPQAVAQRQAGGGVGSKIGGALSGAASGAKIGSMIMPGIGTAIGGIGGALAGLFGGGGKPSLNEQIRSYGADPIPYIGRQAVANAGNIYQRGANAIPGDILEAIRQTQQQRKQQLAGLQNPQLQPRQTIRNPYIGGY